MTYGFLKEAYDNNDNDELIHILSLMQDESKKWSIHGLWVDYYKSNSELDLTVESSNRL